MANIANATPPLLPSIEMKPSPNKLVTSLLLSYVINADYKNDIKGIVQMYF